ncbi:MAG: YkgJ family cysteine cluster protein [Syntrophobacteraceae bacterium]|nr:YkgJ family cysteine cluster protein [Syntrophobacteraceae bacterium]
MENQKLFDSNRLKRSLKRKAKAGNSTVKLLCRPGFPLYYMLRNLGWLKGERWWTSLSSRARRVNAIRMLGQRASLFKEVKSWRDNLPAAPESLPCTSQDLTVPEYCNKCGLCCEVASGMDDFPFPAQLPAGWKEFFGNGLGKGHRFCPFLWEDNSASGGLCSIYQLRSRPCRLFGPDECEFFWNSSEPGELSDGKKILKVARWLVQHSNWRQISPRVIG